MHGFDSDEDYSDDSREHALSEGTLNASSYVKSPTNDKEDIYGIYH
jgi:hypothetical protein